MATKFVQSNLDGLLRKLSPEALRTPSLDPRAFNLNPGNNCDCQDRQTAPKTPAPIPTPTPISPTRRTAPRITGGRAMSGVTIEILPKMPLKDAFTQSADQAIDVGDYKTGSIQAWVDGLATDDTVSVNVEQANIRQDTAFVPPTSTTFTVTDAQTSNTAGHFVTVTFDSRFIRLSLTPVFAPPSSTPVPLSIRAVLHLTRA